MKPTFSTAMGFQREGIALWRTILRTNRKQEWNQRQFKKFLDEQIQGSRRGGQKDAGQVVDEPTDSTVDPKLS
jgi:hypothetical protein